MTETHDHYDFRMSVGLGDSIQKSHSHSRTSIQTTHSKAPLRAAPDSAHAKRTASLLLRLALIGQRVIPIIPARSIQLCRHGASLLKISHT